MNRVSKILIRVYSWGVIPLVILIFILTFGKDTNEVLSILNVDLKVHVWENICWGVILLSPLVIWLEFRRQKLE